MHTDVREERVKTQLQNSKRQFILCMREEPLERERCLEVVQ